MPQSDFDRSSFQNRLAVLEYLSISSLLHAARNRLSLTTCYTCCVCDRLVTLLPVTSLNSCTDYPDRFLVIFSVCRNITKRELITLIIFSDFGFVITVITTVSSYNSVCKMRLRICTLQNKIRSYYIASCLFSEHEVLRSNSIKH